ncbi:sensor histidine kinase [Bailinhaonella thermotolerans]|uniref:histidine kinase n=1 Tax=Bailinhaonella thermotolerans TaxID=1070861 RepID=A0A3A4APK9_9ACTN|nr:sensor histidine kinase [Bailinhaonella thermotolerans]RJL30375.1 sensor histidine kinase [Bailinhaonella thermotolerans]
MGDMEAGSRLGLLRRLDGPKDVLIPVLIGVLQVMGTRVVQTPQLSDGVLDRVPLDWLGYALLVAGPVALVLRRVHPTAVLLTVVGITSVYAVLGYAYGPCFIALMGAFYAAIVAGRRQVAWLTAGFWYVGLVLYLHLTRSTPGLFHDIAVASFLLLVLVLSEVSRIKHERVAEQARRSSEEALRRASEERLRIARELHDVLAHNISLINVQAGVALHLMDEKPEQARTALAAIKQASKDVLGEMRSVLGVMRQGGEQAPRTPVAGLDGLEELFARFRAAGLRVRPETRGTPRPLPAGVDLAAYRIVQEALTNVTRHAGPQATATVLIEYGPRELTLRVEDDGPPAAVPSRTPGGNGIPGMRERAVALGGTLDARPLPSHGFQVVAHLPIPAFAETR